MDNRGFKRVKTSPGMKPLGITFEKDKVSFGVDTGGGVCRLLLYRRGEDEVAASFLFQREDMVGNAGFLTLQGSNWRSYEYVYEIDGVQKTDPYGRGFCGREDWGNDLRPKVLKARILADSFSWEGDETLSIPMADTIIYRIHVRGFTKHKSSKVRGKGSYLGIIQQIPYLQELGITAVELMPVAEFDECIKPDRKNVNPYDREEIPRKINYWGYTDAFYMAPKAAYASSAKKEAVTEFKEMVKQLHKAGIEVLLEFYFSPEVIGSHILDCLRYWVAEYHIDGFHIVGTAVPAFIYEDAYLKNTKLFAEGFSGREDGRDGSLRGEYNEGFLWDMRKVLKGDDEAARLLISRNSIYAPEYGRVNYIANTNGFTLMDLVSYEGKHNEENGEFGRDGRPYEGSWNCGIEGPTRRKSVISLRKRLIKNGLVLVFLSQGVPLLLSGDEFGNSQNGNNNAYCQDNEISWLHYGLLNKNQDIYSFVKDLIAFRKRHPVFRQMGNLQGSDYLSCGMPDISYHGEMAWFPELEKNKRQLGILYCGAYFTDETGEQEPHIYVAYNMHWETASFALPRLPQKACWHLAATTEDGFYEEYQEVCLEDQKNCLLPPRTIWILVGK